MRSPCRDPAEPQKARLYDRDDNATKRSPQAPTRKYGVWWTRPSL